MIENIKLIECKPYDAMIMSRRTCDLRIAKAHESQHRQFAYGTGVLDGAQKCLTCSYAKRKGIKQKVKGKVEKYFCIGCNEWLSKEKFNDSHVGDVYGYTKTRGYCKKCHSIRQKRYDLIRRHPEWSDFA